MSIYNSLFLCSKLQITRSDFCVYYTSYIKGICTMQGEEHLGNATYIIIQTLFIVNTDYFQTNWHSWLNGGNHLLTTILLQFINWGRFFLASYHTSCCIPFER